MFYKAVVKPGKSAAFVPPPEEHMLHLSQACLAHNVKEGTRVSLLVRLDPDEEPAVLCTLCAGRLDTAALDLFFSHYAEFTVAGGADIHLSGYYSPQHEEMEGGEDNDDDEEEEAYMRHLHHPMLVGEEDDSEDESDDDDEDEDDEDDGFGWGMRSSRQPSAVIQEIEDVKGKGGEKGSKDAGKKAIKVVEVKDGGKKAQQAKQEQARKQQRQQDEEEGSDEEDDSEEDDEGEEDDEDEDSEEEQAPQARAGDKRKGAAAAAVPPGKKQATATAQQQQQQPKTPQPQQDKGQAQAKTPAGKQQQQQAQKTPQQQQQKTPQQQQQQQQQQKTPQQQHKAAGAPDAAPAAGKRSKPRVFDNGFEIHDLSMGQPDGKLARAGKRVSMRYVGRLAKGGKVFDSNTKGKPFAFRLGVGEVIKGWDRGVEGMRVGDKRKLVIPPQMAYGSQRLPGIPPNSTLEFEVELVDVK